MLCIGWRDFKALEYRRLMFYVPGVLCGIFYAFYLINITDDRNNKLIIISRSPILYKHTYQLLYVSFSSIPPLYDIEHFV